jgi:hypothetical protein
MSGNVFSKRGSHVRNRVFPGVSGKRPDLYKIRCEEAEQRQESYNKLSVADKLSKLDSKLGTGVGAKKQRAKLQALLNPVKSDVVSAPETEIADVVVNESKKHLKAKDRRKMEKKHH